MKVRSLDSAVKGDPRGGRAGSWLVWRRMVAMDVWGWVGRLGCLIPLPHQTSLSVATDCNRLQPIGMLGVSPNFGANGSNTSDTSVLLASRRENPYRL